MGSSVSAPFFSAMAVLANFKLCPFFFALAIGIPSALLYCLLLLVIVANFKHFSSPFFILVFIPVLFSIICLLPNLATLLAYKLRSNYQQNGQHAANERKMTIYTIIRFISATHFVDEHNIRRSDAQEWFNVTLEQTDILYLANFNQYPWVNDLSTVVIPAWLLLWASSKCAKSCL
ncbi:hypothetical protein niasHT_032277 [Heterodera trifolii]|uniref:Uncharacterized protein n=1 Tax=Heterodera trifolii TaxID=157864 RepID=A0ABD2HY90_9BILA